MEILEKDAKIPPAKAMAVRSNTAIILFIFGNAFVMYSTPPQLVNIKLALAPINRTKDGRRRTFGENRFDNVDLPDRRHDGYL